MAQDRVLFHPGSEYDDDGGPRPVTGPPTVGPAARAGGGATPPGLRPGGSVGGSGAPIAGKPMGSAAVGTPASAKPVNGGIEEEAPPKIRAMDQRLGGGTSRHEDSWKRTPNLTGSGAIHCKSFHCKLTGDSLENLDRQINEWLDSRPQYEVKFVTTCVGDWLGKLKEPNLIVQVWV